MESGGIIGQLGIDWKLFLSQAFNFFILLLILRAFVYKPLLIVIKKRNEKIKEGLEKAEAADVRLKEVDVIAKGKLKQADQESISIIKKIIVKTVELKPEAIDEALISKAASQIKDGKI